MIKLPSRNILFFNGAAGVVILLGIFSVARATFTTPEVPGCAARYPRSVTLALERDGEPIRLAEFQSDFNGRDFGVADHVAIRSLSEGPAKVVMAVNLGRGSSFPKTSAGINGGVSFPWTPEEIVSRRRVCLTYNVFLPIDFDFGIGGSLPGILGGNRERAEDGSVTEFVARTIWRRDGELATIGSKVERNQRKIVRVDPKSSPVKLARGKWVSIQQEFMQNDPNTPNGIFRLWVDDKIITDKSDVNFVTLPNQDILGIAGEFHFGNELTEQGAPKDERLFATPFVLYLPD